MVVPVMRRAHKSVPDEELWQMFEKQKQTLQTPTESAISKKKKFYLDKPAKTCRQGKL